MKILKTQWFWAVCFICSVVLAFVGRHYSSQAVIAIFALGAMVSVVVLVSIRVFAAIEKPDEAAREAGNFVEGCQMISIEILRAIEDGFTEVVLTNPHTGRKVVLELPRGTNPASRG